MLEAAHVAQGIVGDYSERWVLAYSSVILLLLVNIYTTSKPSLFHRSYLNRSPVLEALPVEQGIVGDEQRCQ